MIAVRALVQGLVGGLAWRGLLLRSRLSGHRGESLDRAASLLHIRRLGAEMLEVLHTVEEDLHSLGMDSTTGPLCSHCREYATTSCGGHAGKWTPTRRPTGSTWTSSGFRISASTVR